MSKLSKQNEENIKIRQNLLDAANSNIDNLLSTYNTSMNGLSDEEIIEENRELYGINKITKRKKLNPILQYFATYLNPFGIVLLILVLVSFLTNYVFAGDGEKNPATSIIILLLLVISSTIRFIEETKSDSASEKLGEIVETTAAVKRDGKFKEIPLDEIVVGDIVQLANGDIIPADVRLISVKDFFVSQNSLTGESNPVEKLASLSPNKKYQTTTDYDNLCFMGTTVISGSANAIVIATGSHTMIGQIATKVNKKPDKTAFDRGVDSVSWLLVKFMLIMAPAVFIINGFTKDNWMNAFLFAISVAVGLTPEMLPMIITSSLARGAINMSKKKVIVKNLSSIQNFGAMDVLCTDKTGTLTKDRVELEEHLNINGISDIKVLKHAFINAYYQTGLKNLMDKSIMEKTEQLSNDYLDLQNLDTIYTKIDEIPFDFARKRMSVVVRDKTGKTQMITKGAVEEIISICSHVNINGAIFPMDEALKEKVLHDAKVFSEKGFRTIAVAQKTNPTEVGSFSVKDESDMLLMGYLLFLDPPKETTKSALDALQKNGIKIKVLTGDNLEVTKYICDKVELKYDKILLGKDIDVLDDDELRKQVEDVVIFAKLSPEQKARVVSALKYNGHVVGYMGDGINDAPALRESDIGISVDTAVDIAKETAHVILLEKDLQVLNDGIIEGRKTYGNMIKYIKITASSNFGNIFSILAAAALLPFLPMLPLHILILNILYDLSCTSIPWDNIDKEFLSKPRRWDATKIGKFMLWFGPTSSVFDWTTYIVMFFIICPILCGGAYSNLGDEASRVQFATIFQTGWFIESMFTQILVIYTLRTKKINIFKAHPSKQVLLFTSLGLIVVTALPYLPFASAFNLTPLPLLYFAFLAVVIILYISFASLIKWLYLKKYGELL